MNEMIYEMIYSLITGTFEPTNDQLPLNIIAQLVRASTTREAEKRDPGNEVEKNHFIQQYILQYKEIH